MGRRRKVISYHSARYKQRQRDAGRPSHACAQPRIDPNIPSTSAASVQPDSDLPSTSAATLQLDSNVQSTSAASVQREQGILPSTSTSDPTSHRPPLKRQKLQATKTSARIAARPHVTYSSQVPTADEPANVAPQVPKPIVVLDHDVDEPAILVPDAPSVDKPPIIVPDVPSVDKPPILIPDAPSVDKTPIIVPDVPRDQQSKNYLHTFAMTINKSQGQTIDNAGLYPPRPVFSHDQLYVAFLRVKCFGYIKIAVEQTLLR